MERVDILRNLLRPTTYLLCLMGEGLSCCYLAAFLV